MVRFSTPPQDLDRVLAMGNTTTRDITTTGKISGKTGVFTGAVDFKSKITQTSTSATLSNDNVNIAGANILVLDASLGDVTIGGFMGGVEGQIVHLVKVTDANDVIITDGQMLAAQQINTESDGDETIENTGGMTLYCDGTTWHEVGHD